jgi:hypothetical protein
MTGCKLRSESANLNHQSCETRSTLRDGYADLPLWLIRCATAPGQSRPEAFSVDLPLISGRGEAMCRRAQVDLRQ